MARWRRHNTKGDFSRIKEAQTEDLGTVGPGPEYWEEIRWNNLPDGDAKIEDLNRRLRKFEAPSRIKLVAKRLVQAILVIGSAAGGVGEVVRNYRLNHPIPAERPRDPNPESASLAIDRKDRPDAGITTAAPKPATR